MENKAEYIKSIEIKGLWGAYDFFWECNPDVNILFGENGTGKSTILRLVRRSLSDELILVKSSIFDHLFLVDNTGHSSVMLAEPGYHEQSYGNRPTGLLPHLQMNYINTFDLAISDLKDKSLIDHELDIAIRKYLVYNADLSAKVFNKELSHKKAFSGKEFLFDKIDDLFRNKKLDRSTGDIQFKLDDDSVLKVSDLSSGEKQMLLLLLTVFVQDSKPSILLLDEPEISLHLRWQSQLIELLKKLNPNCQLFLVTHSPSIFNDGYRDKVFFIEDLMKKTEQIA